MQGNEVSIIIPACNEGQNIAPLADGIAALNLGKGHEIVIVDDNSTDRTGEVAESLKKKFCNVRVLHRRNCKGGMGISLREGTAAASGKIVLWVMGDGSDDLGKIPAIIEKINNGCDMVFASRYMEGGSKGELSLEKAFLSAGYSKIAKILFGLHVNDITNAYRGFRKELFDSIALESEDFSISPEFAIKAHLKGYRLGEVPATYFGRKTGRAKFRILKMAVRYISLFKYFFKRSW